MVYSAIYRVFKLVVNVEEQNMLYLNEFYNTCCYMATKQ